MIFNPLVKLVFNDEVNIQYNQKVISSRRPCDRSTTSGLLCKIYHQTIALTGNVTTLVFNVNHIPREVMTV